jgi:hypothetical protein
LVGKVGELCEDCNLVDTRGLCNFTICLSDVRVLQICFVGGRDVSGAELKQIKRDRGCVGLRVSCYLGALHGGPSPSTWRNDAVEIFFNVKSMYVFGCCLHALIVVAASERSVA